MLGIQTGTRQPWLKTLTAWQKDGPHPSLRGALAEECRPRGLCPYRIRTQHGLGWGDHFRRLQGPVPPTACSCEPACPGTGKSSPQPIRPHRGPSPQARVSQKNLTGSLGRQCCRLKNGPPKYQILNPEPVSVTLCGKRVRRRDSVEDLETGRVTSWVM